MRASLEQSWFAQRRALAAGLLTGVALIAAVVLSRRVAGDASGFASQFWACLVGAIGMAVSACSASAPGILGELSKTQRLLAIAFSSLPGLVLGLSLLPSGSGAGLVALLSLFGLTLGVSSFDLSQIRERSQSKSTPVDAARGLRPSTNDSHSPISEAEPLPQTIATNKPTESNAADYIIDPKLEATLGVVHPFDSVDEIETGSSDAEPMAALAHPSSNPDTVHWLARTIDAGIEKLEGVVTVELAAQERQIAVHIPFVPAFAAVPEFECESIHGEPVDVSVSQIKTYGVRLEVKRSTSDLHDSIKVQVGYFASCEVQAAADAASEPLAQSRPRASA